MITRMSKVEMIGPKGLLSEAIELLHSLGFVHIESMPERILEGERYLKNIPLDRKKARLKSRIEGLIERLKRIASLLPKGKRHGSKRVRYLQFTPDSVEFRRLITDIEKRIDKLIKKRTEIIKELSLISRYEGILRALAPLLARLQRLRFFETVGLTIKLEKKGVIPLIEEEVERITNGECQIFAKDIDDETIGVVLTYARRYSPDIRRLLDEERIAELQLPSIYRDIPVHKALMKMMRRGGELPERLADIESTLSTLSDEWYDKIIHWIDILNDMRDELETINYCAQSRYLFIIIGWVPSAKLPVLLKAVKKEMDDRLIIREVEIKDEEMGYVPVAIENPWYIRPFEVFLSILPPPRYGSTDPTPYLALFFPLFFGIILGDIGYGAILLLVSLFLKRRFERNELVGSISKILTVSSISSIFFGLLFGEFFGDLGERFGIHPILFDRTKDFDTFMFLSIGIGVGHILLGFLLALVNSLQIGKKKKALESAISLSILVLVLASVAIFMGYIPVKLSFSLIMVVVTLILVLIMLEGIMAPVELLRSFSNILSYIRIMAIGTSSVIFALVANRIGERSGSLIVGIVVASVFHLLNIILGVLGPSIQALRLHYVEFFSKFYQPGGRRYKPFRKFAM